MTPYIGYSGSAVLLVTVAALLTAPLSAQYATDFAGTYDLVRVEAVDDSGAWATTTRTFGPGASGIIMYDGRGMMSVHIVRADESAPNRYYAYYGRYSVDAERGVVTHQIENHTNPQQVGSEFVRGFDFDGDLLTLTPEPQRQLRLVWRRRR